ncbi:MAG: hypothetical protein NTX42_02620 [Methanothrix sp.]|nr:hypothetical protein [Methanothrix sp.]
MIVIDICSLRLSQGRDEKETKAHPNKHLPCEKTSLAWCLGYVANLHYLALVFPATTNDDWRGKPLISHEGIVIECGMD